MLIFGINEKIKAVARIAGNRFHLTEVIVTAFL